MEVFKYSTSCIFKCNNNIYIIIVNTIKFHLVHYFWHKLKAHIVCQNLYFLCFTFQILERKADSEAVAFCEGQLVITIGPCLFAERYSGLCK